MGGVANMKYFKSKKGVHAFELDGSQDFLITSDMVQMTEQEASEHANLAGGIEQVLERKRLEIDHACEKNISLGFQSEALGSMYNYKCRRGLDPTDLGAAIDNADFLGGPQNFRAQPVGGAFAEIPHTLNQLRRVRVDLRMHVQHHRSIAQAKKAIAAIAHEANDLAAIEAVDVSDWS